MLAAPIEAGYLEGPGNRAETRDDDLPGADQRIEEDAAHQRIGSFVPEHASAGDARAHDSRSREQFTPAAGRFGVGDVDRVGIEREAARAQAGDSDEIAGAVIQFEEEVLAFLCGHALVSRVQLRGTRDRVSLRSNDG